MPNILTSSAGTRYPLRAVQFSSVQFSSAEKNPERDKYFCNRNRHLPATEAGLACSNEGRRVSRVPDATSLCPSHPPVTWSYRLSRDQRRARDVRMSVCVSARARVFLFDAMRIVWAGNIYTMARRRRRPICGGSLLYLVRKIKNRESKANRLRMHYVH